jgi:protein-S-isoprenylcysteine O-methyltransferase Ste14
MKSFFLFLYSIICYLVGFLALLFWILSLSGLVPEISIDGVSSMTFPGALVKDIVLVLAFGIPHSVMARKSFKNWITQVIPQPIERSTYVLQAGLLLALLVWQWEPLGGNIWSIAAGTPSFYVMYVLFFLGWIILFISTFLINHFDLFGLRQTYFELTGKTYRPLDFKIVAFYKYVRHPLYLGIIMGLWATPTMTVTHMIFAILLTSYVIIGIWLEEKDLIRDFGNSYHSYRQRTPMLIPFLKKRQ